MPLGEELATPASGTEPPIPKAFSWEGRTLQIASVLRTWRTTKNDRGDNYLKRHWFELLTTDGHTIEVYYDREARRGSSRWWLYAITLATPDS
jgi:phosphoribosylglycinamide formyltransferase-1